MNFINFDHGNSKQNFYTTIDRDQSQLDFFVMYDQEPITPGICDIYKQRLQDHIEINQQHLLEDLSWTAVSTLWFRKMTWPLWCSSEYQGDGIDGVAEAGYIPCSYFYHAFIARDWYRHWQYSPALTVQDKSSAPYRFLVYCRETTGSRRYRRRVILFLKSMQSKVKYDWHNVAQVPADYSAKITAEDATDSGIHLVLETLFNTNSLYLTEKVFKPIVMSQPFIIWGPPGTLEFLRRHGFQTFDGIWSESYDRELDHNRRTAMLEELVKQIADLPQAEYENLYKKCLPIIAHNRRRFFENQFMDSCWQELIKNFDQALAQRDSMELVNPGGQLCYYMSQNQKLLEIPFIRTVIKNRLKQQDVDYQHRILVRYPCFVDL